MTPLDFWLWGTGDWPMYLALALAAFTAVFLYLCKSWADALDVIPLNYIAEQRYRTTPITRDTNLHQIFAGGVMMATASSAVAYIPTFPQYVEEMRRYRP